MSEQSVFDFASYKEYLVFRVGKKSERRGLRSALARSLGCHPTYISQIINGPSHLNLEQGERLGEFLGHSPSEQHFFLLLILKERAGTHSLKTYFDTQLKEILRQRMVLTERLGKRSIVSKEFQSKYYSSWIYAAIHIALTIPSLRSKEALAKHLALPLKKVTEALEFLVESELVEIKKNQYYATKTQIRLGNDSENIVKHHSNWRTRAVESLDRERLEELHYSSVFSLSHEDVLRVKDLLLECIRKNSEIVKDSPEEELYALCMDLFSLARDK